MQIEHLIVPMTIVNVNFRHIQVHIYTIYGCLFVRVLKGT